MTNLLLLLTTLLATAGVAYSPAPQRPAHLAPVETPEPWSVRTAGVASALDAVTDADPPPMAAATEDGQAICGGGLTHGDPVSDLLDTLEASAKTLDTFTALVTYEVEDALLGEKVIRKGELIYRVDPKTKKKAFAILFDSRIAAGRKREQLKHYIFSDRWMVEVDHDQKLFIKREIAAPGEEFDPLKLGEGPFPLPIGQPKDEVLSRFDVSLLELPEEGLLRKLREGGEVDGLLLIPKPGTPTAKDVLRIELFYDRATHLPVGVNLIATNDDRKTARLDNIVRNPTLDETAEARLSIVEPDPKQWHIDRRPLDR